MSLSNDKIVVLGPDGVKEFTPPVPDLNPKDPYDTPGVVHFAEGDNTPFVQMNKVNTVAAISSDVTLQKMKKNITRNLPRLHHLPEFKKLKNEPIVLVGGGPSLEDNLEELKTFKTIVACGSVHDYLISVGIVPTYTVVCDPDAISANYLTTPHKNVNYLISSGCDDEVYKALEGFNITQWHCYSDDYLKHQAELEPDFQAVGGGCTVGLRSLSIALMLGYSDIHFFGFDSCLGINNKHHAYGFTDPTQEFLGQLYEIRLGMYDKMNGDKKFICAGYQLAQCSHFKAFYQEYHSMFVPTFHGEGLLTELMKIINAERDKLAKEQNIIIEPSKAYSNLKGMLYQPTGAM